ncbi:proton-conducting transporter membrane subunit [Fundidesulfovibrio agrisoli]|uniref:proton-conducting transporter transmembrane domain-containing protein n=1 Tax=Fundidesulfovibrio agrisoli TaxID=2922717 RepID=UPI001FAC8BD9|nr:proton-conducting transporter membrane subunit [Fundidesulfovibrio agrisoli]
MQLATSLGLLVGAALLVGSEVKALRSLGEPKRLMAFSALAQTGYVLIGLSLGSFNGLTGAFLHIGYQALIRALWYTSLRRLAVGAGGWNLETLRGAGQGRETLSVMMGFAMFCALGISPVTAPAGKPLVLFAAVDGGHMLTALAMAFSSAIAAVYTVRLFQAVCLEKAGPKAEGAAKADPVSWALMAASVLACLFPHGLIHMAASSAAGILGLADIPAVAELEGSWPLQVLVPYLGGFAVYAVGRLMPAWRSALVLAVAAATVAAAWFTPGLAPLQNMFTTLYALVGGVIIVYSLGYVGEKPGSDRYFLFLFMMVGTLVGLASAKDAGGFYVSWELMTFSSYMLVVHKRSEEALKAGARYFIMCVSGAYAMQVGLMALVSAAPHGALMDAAQAAQAMGPAAVAGVALLLLGGFAVKAGLFPLHSWLPVAHPVAPSSISAPLSGLLTKAGVFGMALVLPMLFQGSLAGTSAYGLPFLLTLLAACTFVLGEVMALIQSDIKRMLAYSTLAQIGEIALVLSLGTWAATTGALGHVVNHAVMKDLLFLAAGGLIMRAGTQRIDALAGIGRAMPFTGACMALGLVAIMGLPPFNGFYSKFLMLHAALEAGSAWIAVLVLAGSLVGCVYYGRLIKVLFFTPYKGAHVLETPMTMRLGVGALAAVTVLGGLFPHTWLSLVTPAADALFPGAHAALPDLTVTWALPVILPLLGAVAAIVLRADMKRAGLAATASLVLAAIVLLAQSGGWGSLQFAFALLVLLTGACNMYYSTGYMSHSHTQWRFYAVFLTMIAGLVGMGTATGFLAFFCFWEIMSSWPLFLAIIHEESPAALKEGTKYFLFNVAGASFLFLGVLLVGRAAGGYGFEQVALALKTLPPAAWMTGVCLIGLGMLMKAAMLPIRIDWQMHPPTAPTPVSGYISSMLLKSAPFGLLFLRWGLAGGVNVDGAAALDTAMYVGAWIGGITIIYAAIQALLQTGIKEMLIYSTVSQLGYIVMAICLGTPLGVTGGMLHFFNHMLFKNLAFLCAGALMFATHAHSLEELGGIGRKMPMTLMCFAVALFSVAGMPPFNGFSSKLTIYYALIDQGEMTLAIIAILSSVITLAYFLKFMHSAFFGQLSPKAAHAHEVGLAMRAPIMVLAGLCILTGVFPGIALIPIASIQQSLGIAPLDVGLSGILSGPGASDMTLLSFMIVLSGGSVWMIARYATRTVRRTAIHLCGETSVTTQQTNVAASNLYAAPLELLARMSRGYFTPKRVGGGHD